MHRIAAQIISILLFVLLTPVAMAFTLSSPAFHNGANIPQEYTCKGRNINPPLIWVGVPYSAKSFALIMSDPDSPRGVWDHWIVYNIPVNVHEILPGPQYLPAGSMILKNSWGNARYDGPCPPSGTHHYWLTLYALNTTINLSPSATKSDLEAAMQNNIVSITKLMGTVTKQ